jgi:thymidylate synthase (FAD)
MKQTWKKFYPLTDQNAFICLVDSMGDDSSILQAARVSYGKDEQKYEGKCIEPENQSIELAIKDRNLIRYLLRHSHTTPFEMVEFKFMVQVPMDCWRQWVRHRTASINEYSTRYTEALDFFQVTSPEEWRLQATDNKQGSSGFLEEWPEEARYQYNSDNDASSLRFKDNCSLTQLDYKGDLTPGKLLSEHEEDFHYHAKQLYQQRLLFGIAKEQARKDLPLSTYTRAYWKCDLHNIFNFLRLRMDSHAQLEIRQFANCMFEIVKSVCPVACEAFEDYVLHSKKFSRMEMEILRQTLGVYDSKLGKIVHNENTLEQFDKPSSMSDREWKEFLDKLAQKE